jgi:hypothetical protein
VILAYALPATVAWLLIGLALTALLTALLAALPLTGATLTGTALAVVAGYGGYYGITELTGLRGLVAPGRRWQVPQTMMIGASPRRRLLVWGAILGPGLLTRNPYAGFGLLVLVVAAMHAGGAAAALAAAGAIGLAHGAARAAALLRDVGEHQAEPAGSAATAQLGLLLKTVYWRRCDGVALLAAALIAAALAVHYL